nr:sugar nucleotide-binding protein [Armatimonadota bacterium]
ELDRPARRPAYSVLSLRSIEEQGLFPRLWQQAVAAFLKRIQPSNEEERR